MFRGQEKGKSRVLLPTLSPPSPLLPVSLHVPEVAVSLSSHTSVEQPLLQRSFLLENRLWATQSSLLVPSGLGWQWLPHSCLSLGASSLLIDSLNPV